MRGSALGCERALALGCALCMAVFATACASTATERVARMPATVCMTADNRCPPQSGHAAARARGPVERAVDERPADTAAICEQAMQDFEASAEQVDRRCGNDGDCVVLDFGYCGTLARRGTSAPELFERWRDLGRAGCVGDVECASYGAVCVRGQCESPPPLRG